MHRRKFLGAIAAVLTVGMTVRHSPALAKEGDMSSERFSPNQLDADLPSEEAIEAQYYSNRGVRRRRGGYGVRRRRVVYGSRRMNYGRRRSLYVRRRNSARRSVRRRAW